MLLYMTAGKKSLAQQGRHNLKQTARWLKLWRATGVPLKAKNRFGDQLEIRFRDVRSIVAVSVVSCECGVTFHAPPIQLKQGFLCTIPDSLIASIASMNGTIIDLLSIIDFYTDNFGRHLVQHSKTGAERLKNSYTLLKSRMYDVEKRFRIATSNIHENDDLVFIHNLLGMHRLPAPLGDRLVNSKPGREQIVEFFGDMSASDYLLLAAVCLEAIKATDKQRITVAARTQGMYLNWNILATSIRETNMTEFFDNFVKSNINTPHENYPMIIFGYDLDGADYRSPMMYALPPERTGLQSEYLISKISKHISRVLAARGISAMK